MLTRSKSDIGKKTEKPIKKDMLEAKTSLKNQTEETAVKALSPEKPGPSGLNSGVHSNLSAIQEVSSISVTASDAASPAPAQPATDGDNSTENPATAVAGIPPTAERAPGAQDETKSMETGNGTQVKKPTALSISEISDIGTIWKDIPSMEELERLLGIESEADRLHQ